MFLSILKTCVLIRQKKVNAKMIISIVMDQLISFISQYEWSRVEIIKYKVSVVANNNKVKEGHDIHSNRDEVNIFLYESNYTIQ